MHLAKKPTEDLIPTKTVPTKHGDLHFYCAGRVCLYRADTFHTKEPETLDWIDTFSANDVVWDIGANVGVYSLYASLLPGVKVLAFEPSAFNYFVLMKNIDLNEADKKISALCLAFSDSSALCCLNMNYLEVGDSCHDLIDYTSKEAYQNVGLQQSVLTLSIDDFLFNFTPPFPNHIKIDVDGAEARIIKGAEKTLSDKRLKTVLIEIDDSKPEEVAIIDDLQRAGLKMISRRQAPQYAGSTINNCVFARI